MAGGGADELLFACEFELHGAVQAQGCEGCDVFGEEFLLAAEAAAHPRADDADLFDGEAEHGCQPATGEEGHLRTRADVEAAFLVEPGDGGMRFKCACWRRWVS